LANIKASKKDILRSRKNRMRNMAWKSRCKTLVSKTRTAIAAGDPAVAAEMAREASRQLDKASTKGVIHPRQAARRKARLIRRLNTLGSAGTGA